MRGERRPAGLLVVLGDELAGDRHRTVGGGTIIVVPNVLVSRSGNSMSSDGIADRLPRPPLEDRQRLVALLLDRLAEAALGLELIV